MVINPPPAIKRSRVVARCSDRLACCIRRRLCRAEAGRTRSSSAQAKGAIWKSGELRYATEVAVFLGAGPSRCRAQPPERASWAMRQSTSPPARTGKEKIFAQDAEPDASERGEVGGRQMIERRHPLDHPPRNGRSRPAGRRAGGPPTRPR
jgi:hypothetical protein